MIKDGFILTEIKEMVMTMSKTTTTVTKMLEEADADGLRTLKGYNKKVTVESNSLSPELRRAA